ncbi:ribosome biogenesis protein BOP1 homolog [Vanessa cardui]|uniref:ribosome biogenesis protein BOP1 homolog n=1 Tax=Vanessa cardui TaxID=171605 RepID=UPI001F12A14C|nr:ribosome biogenesis protein BOP1 homolog [Vanessa cardui]
MPPYKAGLKRKVISDKKSDSDIEEKDSNSDNEVEDLLQGDLDKESDATDSEHEQEDAGSDGERDEVLFDDSADSLLEEDQQSEESLEESSDLSDSEDNDSGDSADDDESQPESDEEESADSGAETGTAPSASGSSDESNKKNQVLKKDNEKSNIKQAPTKKKAVKQRQKKKMSSIDVLANKIQEAKVSTEPVQQKDEYESGDTSDEEDRVNTAGEVPMWWYNEYPHIGYDLDGRRLIKPPQRDHIDEFLKKCEDPEFWRTVRDPSTGQDIVLSKEDLQMLERLRQSRVPSATHDEYEPWVEWFSREVLATPLRAFPEHKRSFLPSRSEQKQISRIVHALKMGWTKTRKQIADERKKKKERQFYNLWGAGEAGEAGEARAPRSLPAPRRALPTHAESYNPPPEYLLDRREMKEWDKLSETPWKRKYTFLPTRHASLRDVPAYPRYVRERFLRCLDLYLAPRAIKMRLTINAEDLVPKLPSPRDLQPFPTSEVLRITGHEALVRSVDFDPSGQYIVSGSDDGTVKVWETSSGRCLRTVRLGAGVARVAWTPALGLSLVAVALGRRLLLLNPGADIGAHRVAADTDALLAEPPPAHDVLMDERTSSCVQWEVVDAEQWARGVRVAVAHFKPVTHVAWHARGDYVAVTLAEGAARAVVVHQLSRRRSQLPFRRAKGLVQCAVFHPHRPLIFVATQRVVRVYDLVKQELVRKLQTGAQWISAIAVHPAGDNLLVASYDRKLVWFDLELSARPYQTLRLHGGAVRSVAFHRRYPLFASAGDDRYLVVAHGMVYNDLLQNPLLVPLKQLPGPERCGELCVLDVRWHPAQPWLLAAAADNTIRLYA